MRRLCIGLYFATLASAFQPDPALLRKAFEARVAECEHDFASDDPRTAAAARDLGFFLKPIDKPASAAAFSKALRIDQAKFGPDAPQTLAGMIALADVSSPATAEALLNRALHSPGMNPNLAVPALSALGDLHLAAKDRAGAASFWRLALPHAEVVNGKESDAVAKILGSLSQAVPTNEAIPLLRRAREISTHVWGEKHPETATWQVNLAKALLKAGKINDAATAAQQGLEAFEASLGPAHPRVAAALTTLADIRRATGQKDAAIELYRRAIQIDRQALGERAPQTLADHQALTVLLKNQPASVRPPARK